MNNKNILVTGGLGFIGSNFINYVFENYDGVRLFNIDKGGVGSNIENVHESIRNDPRYFVTNDDLSKVGFTGTRVKYSGERRDPIVFWDTKIDYIFHFAAESHVDRSNDSPLQFIESNVLSTTKLLEYVRLLDCSPRFVYVSTDEVTGSVARGSVKENAPYNPSSSYSASKAASELICGAYAKSHGVDVVITRCANNYGPNQFEEKLIPKVIKNCLECKKIPVYDQGLQKREWVYVDDHIKDLLFVACNGHTGEIYNVGNSFQMTNISLVKQIIKLLGKSEDLIEFVPNARVAHDFRYSINLSKLKGLQGYPGSKGKMKKSEFNEKLKQTVDYYEKKFNR